MNKLFFAAAGMVCAGCTTSLTVHRVDPAEPATRVGVPYPLMFTQYEIEITRQVAACGKQLKALVKAEIKGVAAAPDPKQLFALDPNSLSSPVKTSEVKLEYQPNGAVSALNAKAEDRSAQVIANVAATAFKIASIVAAAGGPPEKTEACSDAVLKARAVVKKQAANVETASTVVESLTADVKALNKKIAAMGSNVDEPTKKALSKAYDALTRALDDLDEKKKVLDKTLKVITYVDTVRWPGDGDAAEGAYPVPAPIFARWTSPTTKPNPNEREQFTVYVQLTGIDAAARTLVEPNVVKPNVPKPNVFKPDIVNPELGVPYRQPVAGQLKVCAGGKCGPDNLPIAERTGDVLQMGYVYYLPCKSRPFSSIGCTYTMTESGQVKTMGTTNQVATAEVATGALKDLATQAGTLQETLASATTKRLQAATAELKAQADYATAKAALQPDPLAPDKDELAALKASTDLLVARRAELEARAALEEAMAKTGKGGSQ